MCEGIFSLQEICAVCLQSSWCSDGFTDLLSNAPPTEIRYSEWDDNPHDVWFQNRRWNGRYGLCDWLVGKGLALWVSEVSSVWFVVQVTGMDRVLLNTDVTLWSPSLTRQRRRFLRDDVQDRRDYGSLFSDSTRVKNCGFVKASTRFDGRISQLNSRDDDNRLIVHSLKSLHRWFSELEVIRMAQSLEWNFFFSSSGQAIDGLLPPNGIFDRLVYVFRMDGRKEGPTFFFGTFDGMILTTVLSFFAWHDLPAKTKGFFVLRQCPSPNEQIE